MKKLLLVLLLAGAAILAFSCGGNNGENKHQSPECENLASRALKALKEGDLQAYFSLTNVSAADREEMINGEMGNKYRNHLESSGGIESYEILSSKISFVDNKDEEGNVISTTKQCVVNTMVTYGNESVEPWNFGFSWDETDQCWYMSPYQKSGE